MPARPTTTAPSPALPQLQRGVLIRIDRMGEGAPSPESTQNTALVFQYNPDVVTRARTGRWEVRSARNTFETPQDVRAAGGAGAAHLMAESETISLKITFDATEEILAGRGTSGVLEELAFLETASLGRTQENRRGQGTGGSAARSVKPDEMLLVLGMRKFPVVLTGLTVVEQKFAPDLTPIRAEADLRFNVLEPAELAFNTWVDDSFTELVRQRTQLAQAVQLSGSVDVILADAIGGNPASGTTADAPREELP